MNKEPTCEELEQRIKELEKEALERKRAEDELKYSEERYRALVENAPIGIYYNDFYGTFLYGNKRSEEIIGYQKEELIGKNFLKLRLLSPKYLGRAAKLLALNRLGKATGPDELHLMRKDGSGIIVEINTEVVTIEGKRVVLGMVQDITYRKRAEEALQESEKKYRTVVENSLHGIFIFQQDFTIQFVNRAAASMFGYEKPDELVGLNSLDTLIAPEYHREIKRRVADIGDGKSIPTHPGWQGIKRDGTRIWIQSTGTRHLWKGRPAVLAYILDITDYKKAEEEKRRLEAQLLQAQKMESIGTLAGGLAHNFNNLLMGIMGNTSIMLLDSDPSHPHYNNLKNIEKSIQSGSGLTKQLLGYAREGRYEVKPINLNRLVKETSDTFSVTRKEIRVHQDLAEHLLGINADQGQIEQILMNLYVNAADAMPLGGDLFIKTMNVTDKDMKDKPYETKPGNYILVTLRDTGVGMDAKTKDRIFDPFFTTKGLAEGTGLGLASAYGIVKAHGGYIDVDSEEGRGTTFEIYLPATDEETKGEEGLSGELVKGKETVLFVDDEEMVLDAGEQMLKTLGYEVLSAGSGQEALELYEKNQDKIDLVLLDMIMPGVSGGKTFDRLKEIKPGVKVLLSSGYSIDGQATEILKRGCDGFIQKPFSMQGLSQNIRKILDKGNKGSL